MEAYKIHETIGDGSFGIVFKASVIKTGEIVAIKKMKKKFSTWDECMALRELKSLRKLIHDNIIKLKEVIRVKDELSFVFEYMDQNVYQLYTQMRDNGKTLSENQIKSVVYQTASGLAYMHKHGFFHRDLKPENILMTKGVAKIADFGLAREIRSRPPYTDYVATRWYRAPEILLKSTNYNSPVDIFALGCIMAELYLMAPLFKGNNELEQMFKICSILGSPTPTTWNEGLRLAAQAGFSFPQFTPTNLASVMPNAPDEAIQLITEMLRMDPQKRPSAQQVLQHPYFAGFSMDKPVLFSTSERPVSTGSRKSEYSHLYAKPEYKESDLSDDLKMLGIEDHYIKDLVDKDMGYKKTETKKSTKELNVTDDVANNTDALLAEIDSYVNSVSPDTMQFSKGVTSNTSTSNYGNSYNPGFNAGLYQANSMKAPVGSELDNSWDTWNTPGPTTTQTTGQTGPLGPSAYDIYGSNTGMNNQYSQSVQYGQPNQYNQYGYNPQGGDNSLYGYNTNANANMNSQWSGNTGNTRSQSMSNYGYGGMAGAVGGLGVNVANSTKPRRSQADYSGSNTLPYGKDLVDDNDLFGKKGY